MSSHPVTVTLNPALDQTCRLRRLVPGEVHRVRETHLTAGGKGLNVARFLDESGYAVTVNGFLGSANCAPFDTLITERGFVDRFVRLPGDTRIGIKIVEDDYERTTDLNFPGLAPGPGDVDRLFQAIDTLAAPGRWFAIAGSLPPGFGPDQLRACIARIRAKGSRVALDTSGEALQAGLTAAPDLVKPNLDELNALVGRTHSDLPEMFEALQAIRREYRVPRLSLSLGARGALYTHAENACIHAPALPVRVASTVGAGDAFLAGLLVGIMRDETPACSLRRATAYAASCLESLDRRLPPSDRLAARIAAVAVNSCPG